MHPTPLRHLVALTVLAAAALAAPAHAQGTRHSVDIHGKLLPRTTLAAACPAALTELPDALAATARAEAQAGTVQVQLELDHRGVLALHTEGGTLQQARAVRRAVRALGCASATREARARQGLQFAVRFVDPFERGGQAVALLEATR